jgi:hypothetical protein
MRSNYCTVWFGVSHTYKGGGLACTYARLFAQLPSVTAALGHWDRGFYVRALCSNSRTGRKSASVFTLGISCTCLCLVARRYFCPAVWNAVGGCGCCSLSAFMWRLYSATFPRATVLCVSGCRRAVRLTSCSSHGATEPTASTMHDPGLLGGYFVLSSATAGSIGRGDEAKGGPCVYGSARLARRYACFAGRCWVTLGATVPQRRSQAGLCTGSCAPALQCGARRPRLMLEFVYLLLQAQIETGSVLCVLKNLSLSTI